MEKSICPQNITASLKNNVKCWICLKAEMQTVRSNRDISTNIRVFIFGLKYPYLSATIIGRSKEDENGSVLQREERSINICAMAVMAETAKGSLKIGQGGE
jgi:hypothetical protein